MVNVLKCTRFGVEVTILLIKMGSYNLSQSPDFVALEAQ